jgi:IS5 family transposase
MVFQRAERLAKTGKDRAIWTELQRQLDAFGLKVSKELPRMRRLSPRIQEGMRRRISLAVRKRRRAEARMARSWAKKGSKSCFGYKLHTKLDTDHGLIRELETTTASTHDSQVDLSKKGEVAYRDRGYHGAVASVESRNYFAKKFHQNAW